MKNHNFDTELELMNILSEEIFNEIDKDELKSMVLSHEMVEKTISKVKQTIRETRLDQILNKK